MGKVLSRTAGVFAATVGVLTLFGLLVGTLEAAANRYLVAAFGWNGVVLTGMVGTPVHEFGHWIMCRLFGFTVSGVALFRPVAGRADGVLGYVRYSYNPASLWQRLGCFFVGIAPMVVGGLVILLLLRLLTPEVYRRASRSVSRAAGTSAGPAALLGAAAGGFFGGLVRLRGWGVLRGLLCLYLICSISMHMSLSPADLAGASVGLLLVLGLCLIYGVVTAALGLEVRDSLRRLASAEAAFFSMGAALCLITTAAARVVLLLIR